MPVSNGPAVNLRPVQPNDPLDLGAQDAAREQREIAAELAAKTEGDDFMWLMSSKRGRRIVWRLLERAKIFGTSFSPDAMQMAFSEGGRNAGLQLVAQIFELCPERYAEMAKEAKQT